MKFLNLHNKHIKKIEVFTLVFLILAETFAFPGSSAFSATSYWTQASWAGGTSGVTATHSNNQNSWTNYTALDAGIAAGANITEAATGKTSVAIAGLTATGVFDAGSGVMLGVTVNGTINRTTDSGLTWKAITTTVTDTLIDVVCSSGSCYAIGNNGTILKSTDNGASWSAQTSGTTTALTAISCSDANTCWIINGTNATVLKTTNGSTWVTQATGAPSPYGFTDIFFLNSTTGWITRNTSASILALKTTDGGTTWTTMDVNVPASSMGGAGNIMRTYSVDFVDINTGFITAYYYKSDTGTYLNMLAKTVDGGANWTMLYGGLSGSSIGMVDAVDSTHIAFGAFTSSSGRVYYTTNGSSFSSSGSGYSTSPKVSCSSTTSCIMNGSTQGNIYTTSNFFTSLTSHIHPQTLGINYRTDGGGFFVSTTTGWAVTNSAGITKTINGGRTWTAQSSGLSNTIAYIYCTDANNCWAVGDLGDITSTTNGGTNWTARTSGTANALYATYFINSSVGMAVGAAGTIQRTIDGGVNWSTITPLTVQPLNGINCSGTTCFAVGNGAVILTSTDSGASWSTQTSAVSQNLFDVYFVSPTVGWIVGGTGTIQKTINGGATWSAQTAPSAELLYTIKCVNANSCYIGGWNNILFSTANGGTTWVSESSPFSDLNARYITWSSLTSAGEVVFGNQVTYIRAISPAYSTSPQTLTSSVYDSGDVGNKVNGLTWDETVAGGTLVKFQIRTSPDNVTWTSYLGPDGTTGSYFSNSGTGCSGSGTINCTVGNVATIGDGANDRYYQYKIYLTATETVAPTVDNVIVQYVVNVAPNFDTSYDANGISVVQNVASTSPAGQVVVTYKVRDADTTSGGVGHAGFVTPSFEYNLNDGAGWQAVTAGFLAAGDLDPKAVTEVAYNTYTATWNVSGQLGTAVSTTTAQIRVTVDDLEGANRTAIATETGVTIDTAPPVITAATFNGIASMIYATTTDLFMDKIMISNNADGSPDGVNANSGLWVATSSQYAWLASASNTMYFSARDQYGNTSSTTIVGVASSTSMNIRDVSNPAETNPRLFTSWAIYTNVTGATFANYKIYRGDSSGTETYLTTVSNIAQNYYIDSAVSSTTRYYYRTSVVDTNGDESAYSDEVNGIPNGQGFGTDLVAPIISNVVITNVKATTVDVTWLTDELSDSYVDYSISPSTAFGTTQSSPSFMTTHTISLTGLTPSTNYLIKVRSRDIYGNIGSSDNGSAGYAFTTTGGPVITGVSVIEVTDTTATIQWNTDKDSSSLVHYSTNSTLSGAVQAGSIAMVGGAGPIWQHTVTLTGLAQQTKYYFKVRSLDATDNIGEDTNSGVYYSFNTSRDTAPPTFSDIAPILITSDAVSISCITNKKATTQISYGPSTGVYPLHSILDNSLTINHSAALLGLSETTPYYYVVASVDANGNAATSSENTFTTTAVTVTTRYISTNSSGRVAAAVGEGLAAALGGIKDTIAPTVSGVKVDPKSLSAKISLSVNEPASVFVQYGEDVTNGYPLLSGSFDYQTSPTITLPVLKMGTTYHYSIKTLDKAGNISNTPDDIFKTQFLSEPTSVSQLDEESTFRQKIEDIMESALPSLSPPFLTKPRITEVTSNSATIEWDTNIPASSLITFAPTELFIPTAATPYIGEFGSAQERVKNHKVELIGLNSATTYHAQAVSQGIVGPFGKSVDFTFITKPSVPEVSIFEVGPTKISVGWKTNSLTDSFVEYRNLRTNETQTKGTDNMVRDHIITLEELTPNTRYELKVFGRDADGNKTESLSRVVSTVIDNTPPQLINVKINNALVPGRTDILQTIVSWKTDEPADSQVFYSEGSVTRDELANKTALDPVLTTDHTVIISTLKPGTVYRFRVASNDQVGNKSQSTIQVVLTPQQAESVIDVISTNLEQSFGWIKLIRQ